MYIYIHTNVIFVLVGGSVCLYMIGLTRTRIRQRPQPIYTHYITYR